MSTEGGTRAVIAAMLANLGIAISKFVAFAFTGSSSMLSEAIHSVADTCNQILLLIGGKRSQQQADEEHNFGYGRRRFVYAFIVAIVLFLLGGVFSIYEGVHKIQHPEPVESVGIALGVLAVSVVLEGFSWRTAMRETHKSRGRRTVLAYIRRAKEPELPVVLLEDTGALIGLCFALIGVSAAAITGDGRWDGMGAMAVGILLLVIAVFLAFEMASMLIGESALPEVQAQIREAAVSVSGVERIINLRTSHVGPDSLMVALKLQFADRGTVAQLCEKIDEVELAVRSVVPTATYVYVEPGVFRAGYTDQRPAPSARHDAEAQDG